METYPADFARVIEQKAAKAAAKREMEAEMRERNLAAADVVRVRTEVQKAIWEAAEEGKRSIHHTVYEVQTTRGCKQAAEELAAHFQNVRHGWDAGHKFRFDVTDGPSCTIVLDLKRKE